MSDLKHTFTKARELLAERGNWVQNIYTNERGCYCIVGAVLTAQGYSFPFVLLDDNAAIQTLAQVLAPDSEEYADVILFRWNDAEERTHVEVLQLLDKAIAHV